MQAITQDNVVPDRSESGPAPGRSTYEHVSKRANTPDAIPPAVALPEELASLRGAVRLYGKVRALDGVDLSLHAGELLALLGRNGAGKTTAIGLSGLELAQRIQRHGLPVHVVIATTFAHAGFLRRALDAGVRGYVLKDAPAEQLAGAIRQVHHGGHAIDPQLAVGAWGEVDPLNDRERQVLRLAGEGRSAGEIAAQLGLSQGTVRNYLSEAIGKLGVGNRIEAFRLAWQKGWL